MRKVYLYAIITLLLSLPQFCFSQKIITISDWPKTIVYAGSDNSVSLMVEGYMCRNLVFRSKKGTIKNQAGCHFDYFAANCGSDTVSVFIKENQKLKKIGEREFDIRIRPRPEPSVGGYSNGDSIHKGAFIAQAGVSARVMGYAMDDYTHFEVIKFQLVISRGSEIVFSGISQSNRFTKEMGEAFRDDLQPGDKVLIFDIHSVGPDKIPFRQDPLEFGIQ